MKPEKLASSIPPEEQAKIDRHKLIMENEKAKMFQSFCETIYKEKVSDKAKAKKLQNAWLYCLGLAGGKKMGPLEFASAIKTIIKKAKENGVELKAFEKIRAMADIKKMFKKRRLN